MTPEIGDTLDGRFVLVELIGSGGMGIVFRAIDVATGYEYALKVCVATDEVSLRRFAREMRFMTSISHEHVISIVSSSLDCEPPYIVMPLAIGSLSKELSGPMDEERAIESILQICYGVQAIHSAGGTHRDIKPENVLRLSDGKLVVGDLGVMKMEPRDTTVLTQTANVVGTRIYCAPEQLIPGGSRAADERTDIYLLGKTLYHILTGELPALIDPGRLPTSLAIIVQRATREHPTERYQTVGQMIDAINGYAASRRPGASASSVFDGNLAEAAERAKAGIYSTENLNKLFDALMNFADDAAVLVDQVARIPDPVMQVAAIHVPARMVEMLVHYVDALESDVGRRGYDYAEIVGAKMMIVIEATGDVSVKANAIVAVLVAAVKLNRFAAMEMFDKAILAIQSESEGVAVADALTKHMNYYRRLAHRVPRIKLHAALQAVFDVAGRE